MGLVSRGAALVLALVAGLAGAGCGGSVADADNPAPRVAQAPQPPSPFCAAAEENRQAVRPLNGLVARGPVPPDQLAQTVAAIRQTGADMVNTAPPEVRADVEHTVQTLEMQLDVLVANGGDAAAVSRDPQVTARLGSQEAIGASQRLRSYLERACGPTPTNRR